MRYIYIACSSNSDYSKPIYIYEYNTDAFWWTLNRNDATEFDSKDQRVINFASVLLPSYIHGFAQI